MKILTLVCSLVVMLGLAACNNTAERPTVNQRLVAMGLQMGEGNLSIPSYRINGWNAVDDMNLVVTAGVNDSYLVRLRSPCIELRAAFRIGFSTPMNRLDRFGGIIVRGPGRTRDVCRIQNIYRLYPL